jgi:hypothetical protein
MAVAVDGGAINSCNRAGPRIGDGCGLMMDIPCSRDIFDGST